MNLYQIQIANLIIGLTVLTLGVIIYNNLHECKASQTDQVRDFHFLKTLLPG